MDALDHHHSGIRKAADEVLELILELDRRPQESTSLASVIKKKRFDAFNAQWLSFMNASGMFCIDSFAIVVLICVYAQMYMRKSMLSIIVRIMECIIPI